MLQVPRLITLGLALLFLPKDVIEVKVRIECTGPGGVFTFVVFVLLDTVWRAVYVLVELEEREREIFVYVLVTSRSVIVDFLTVCALSDQTSRRETRASVLFLGRVQCPITAPNTGDFVICFVHKTRDCIPCLYVSMFTRRGRCNTLCA